MLHRTPIHPVMRSWVERRHIIPNAKACKNTNSSLVKRGAINIRLSTWSPHPARPPSVENTQSQSSKRCLRIVRCDEPDVPTATTCDQRLCGHHLPGSPCSAIGSPTYSYLRESRPIKSTNRRRCCSQRNHETFSTVFSGDVDVE